MVLLNTLQLLTFHSTLKKIFDDIFTLAILVSSEIFNHVFCPLKIAAKVSYYINHKGIIVVYKE